MTGPSTAVQVTPSRALAAARMLVAAYFIAHATGVIVMPEGIAFVPRGEAAKVSSWAQITVVWLTGVALFVGRIVRPAALILGLYTVFTALVSHSGLFGGQIAPRTLWIEIAMVGALSLIALTANPTFGAAAKGGGAVCRRDEDDELSRAQMELAATRAALAEIQASDTVISYAPPALRRSA